MPFQDGAEAERRLLEPRALTPQDVRDLIPWNQQINEKGKRRLDIELNLQNLEAIQKFDQSSSKLTKSLILLTWVLVVLTSVILFYTVLLARR